METQAGCRRPRASLKREPQVLESVRYEESILAQAIHSSLPSSHSPPLTPSKTGPHPTGGRANLNCDHDAPPAGTPTILHVSDRCHDCPCFWPVSLPPQPPQSWAHTPAPRRTVLLSTGKPLTSGEAPSTAWLTWGHLSTSFPTDPPDNNPLPIPLSRVGAFLGGMAKFYFICV